MKRDVFPVSLQLVRVFARVDFVFEHHDESIRLIVNQDVDAPPLAGNNGIVKVPGIDLDHRWRACRGRSVTSNPFKQCSKAVGALGLLAAWRYYSTGYVDVTAAGLLALGFFVGAPFGAFGATALHADTLRKVFGVQLLLISLHMIFAKGSH